jgi:hypothetical protein
LSGGHLDIHSETTTDFNIILTNDMDRQFVSSKNPVIHDRCLSSEMKTDML